MIFDGDCGFCRLWIARWRALTARRVDFAPYQEVAASFPQIPRERFAAAVQLVEEDDKVYSGAEAVFRSLTRARGRSWLYWCYRKVPGFARMSESAYGVVARNRLAFSWVTYLFWGAHVEPPRHELTRGIFLKGLAAVYFTAFASLWTQIHGLIGHNGIIPVARTLEVVATDFAGGFFSWPTVFWLNASDAALSLVCGAGVAVSVVLFFGIASGASALALWFLYLSLSTAGMTFLGFQWDALLLETGFLAVFFAPWTFKPGSARAVLPPASILWLLRWLLFRLMFSSGLVKLASGDRSWHDLTALTVHYETQPIPTWVGWYAHQLPFAFQKFSCAAMFAIELGVPFLIFAPRRPRITAAYILIAFQIIILLTGNYAYFNWLSIVLCFALFDDFHLERFRRRSAIEARRREKLAAAFLTFMNGAVVVVVLLLSGMRMAAFLGPEHGEAPRVAQDISARLEPFRLVSGYGLFAVMTQQRPEIVIEGSDDKKSWKEYEFRYKTGDVRRRPWFVAPHQPRLDWQMWFAALGSPRNESWFGNFLFRILQGSPEVLGLLSKNPFPEKPPRYLRAELYRYRFSDLSTRRREGVWWTREYVGPYTPVMSLNADRTK